MLNNTTFTNQAFLFIFKISPISGVAQLNGTEYFSHNQNNQPMPSSFYDPAHELQLANAQKAQDAISSRLHEIQIALNADTQDLQLQRKLKELKLEWTITANEIEHLQSQPSRNRQPQKL